MLAALLLTFREGLESFLIVGVIVGYLKKTGRASLVRGVQVGLAVSIVTCVGGALWLWAEVPNQPLYEGIAAIVAAVLVGALLVQMVRMGRHMKKEIESRLDRALGAGARGDGAGSLQAQIGVALVTTLLVTREGLEAVFYLRVQAMAVDTQLALIGAGIGLVLAGALAFYWARYGHRVQLGVLLKVTAVFLSLFLAQLLIYGIHELAESGVIEGSQAFHNATEKFGPDGTIGHLISYSLLGAPLLYFFWARRAGPPSRPSTAT